jgi:proline dehydrogenase
MEDSPYTQRTLDLVTRTHVQLDNVGTVIQAYLYRSKQDTADLLNRGIRIRLVKGAYLEPESIAFPKKKDTDANFVLLMRMLLAGESYNAIATHDEAIVNATREFAPRSIPKRLSFRCCMECAGICGYGWRRNDTGCICFPYGQRWYPIL